MNIGTGSVGMMLSMTGHQRTELLNLVATVAIGLPVLRFAATSGGVVSAAIVVAAIAAVTNLVRVVQVKVLLGASPISGRSLSAVALGGALVALSWLARDWLSITEPRFWFGASILVAAVFMISPVGRGLLSLEARLSAPLSSPDSMR
jgi:hypothetical protein